MSQIPVTLADVLDPSGQRMFYLLRQITAKLAAQEDAQAKSAKSKTDANGSSAGAGTGASLDTIAQYVSTALSASGRHPLNITALAGVAAEPQNAAILILTSDPITTVDANQYEVGQFASYNGGLYYVGSGNPHTWVTLTLTPPATMVTTNTPQTIGPGAAKTVADTWTFTNDQNITLSKTTLLNLQLANTNAGATAGNRITLTADQSALALSSYSLARVLTQFGVTLGGWTSLIANLSNGLAIGTTNSASMVFGTNNIERGRFDSGGLTLGGGSDVNGGKVQILFQSELVTLNTGSVTTDSTSDLLPGNSLILAVMAFVTTAITTATTVKLGDATTLARFNTLGSMGAGSGVVGTNQWLGSVATDAAGPTQAAAAKVRLTANVNPGAGVVRLVTISLVFTSPTS
jgi:hypothetical protein